MLSIEVPSIPDGNEWYAFRNSNRWGRGHCWGLFLGRDVDFVSRDRENHVNHSTIAFPGRSTEHVGTVRVQSDFFGVQLEMWGSWFWMDWFGDWVAGWFT